MKDDSRPDSDSKHRMRFEEKLWQARNRSNIPFPRTSVSKDTKKDILREAQQSVF